MNNVKDFFSKFQNDDACLEHLMETRFGKEFPCPSCKRIAKFYKVAKRPVYACQWCGHHINPMAGTLFQDTHTPLQKWFYAMYLFTTTRHGVAAKELQRQLSVTYKTAWRMAHQIRQYMADVDGDDELSGHIEADETMIGGKRHGKRGRGAAGKTVVFGMVQRGGDVMTKIVPNVKRKTLQPHIIENVKPGSTVNTDEWPGYNGLNRKGFEHQTVNHRTKEYARGPYHTNSIEGFWSQIKRSIKGTHIHVSRKHLPKYLGEFEFRYNLRLTPWLMFERLLKSF